MALKAKKFGKMIRGVPVSEQESFEKETINEIRFNELEYLKQYIFVNSLNHIKHDVLREKCSDITTHYRLFKNDESHYEIKELSINEKDIFEKCVGDCIKKECNDIIIEKESIAADLLKFTESETISPNSFRNKLNYMLSLLNIYLNNNKEITSSIFKLLDSSYINITEAQQLTKQVDVIKVNSYKLQSDIINKFSCSKELFKSLEKCLKTKESECATNLVKLKDLQKQQDKYKEVDGPEYKALVKRFIHIQEIIKIKTETFNN